MFTSFDPVTRVVIGTGNRRELTVGRRYVTEFVVEVRVSLVQRVAAHDHGLIVNRHVVYMVETKQKAD